MVPFLYLWCLWSMYLSTFCNLSTFCTFCTLPNQTMHQFLHSRWIPVAVSISFRAAFSTIVSIVIIYWSLLKFWSSHLITVDYWSLLKFTEVYLRKVSCVATYKDISPKSSYLQRWKTFSAWLEGDKLLSNKQSPQSRISNPLPVTPPLTSFSKIVRGQSSTIFVNQAFFVRLVVRI